MRGCHCDYTKIACASHNNTVLFTYTRRYSSIFEMEPVDILATAVQLLRVSLDLADIGASYGVRAFRLLIDILFTDGGLRLQITAASYISLLLREIDIYNSGYEESIGAVCTCSRLDFTNSGRKKTRASLA